MAKKKLEELRSQRWFGATDLRSFGHRSRALQMGYAREDFLGKPVIGIINTWSDLAQCHTHFPERVEDIKRGVWQAGGFPVELPAMSLSEQFVKPTSMLYRNFLAMETEELLRQHPIDGAVLMGGCDKTTPATIMGGISMNLPMIFMPAGPMMRGHFGGTILGSGSDVWKYWAEKEAGNITEAAVERHGGRHRPLGRHLHDDGHGLDHDHHRGGARLHAAGRGLDPGGRCRASAHGRDVRAPHRRDGVGGPQAARHRHAQVGRECAGRAQRDGGLDQRHGASGRDGAPRRRADRPEGLRRIRLARSGHSSICALRASG